jgi:hypothetical protein
MKLVGKVKASQLRPGKTVVTSLAKPVTECLILVACTESLTFAGAQHQLFLEGHDMFRVRDTIIMLPFATQTTRKRVAVSNTTDARNPGYQISLSKFQSDGQLSSPSVRTTALHSTLLKGIAQN